MQAWVCASVVAAMGLAGCSTSVPNGVGEAGANCTPTTCGAQGVPCGSVPDGCGAVLNCGTCATDSGLGSDARVPADSGAATDASDAGIAPASPCAAGDPERVFWNDFEDGRYYTPEGGTFDPSRDYDLTGTDPSHFGVVGSNVMPVFDGSKVLRGNLWPDNPDPVAMAAGITIVGQRETWFAIHLDNPVYGITQTPSGDPNAPTPPPGELYVSFWLWYDANFSHQGRNLTTGQIQTQMIKLFYAFGSNGDEWVVTDGTAFANNEISMGGWPPVYPAEWGPTWGGPLGHWSHVEWYFKSETRPVFYEKGQFSAGGFLADGCNPRPVDWTMAFPVPGSNPVTCLTSTQALARNSKDGTFIMKVDGQVDYSFSNMAWNGRFDRISFPAYHGGGLYPIASAGWAIDDVCIRRTAPAGF